MLDQIKRNRDVNEKKRKNRMEKSGEVIQINEFSLPKNTLRVEITENINLKNVEKKRCIFGHLKIGKIIL